MVYDLLVRSLEFATFKAAYWNQKQLTSGVKRAQGALEILLCWEFELGHRAVGLVCIVMDLFNEYRCIVYHRAIDRINRSQQLTALTVDLVVFGGHGGTQR